MKLPARYPIREVLHAGRTLSPGGVDGSVLSQRHPSPFNLRPVAPILQLHLTAPSGVGEQSPRTLLPANRGVDWAFTDFLGDDSDESVRKLRRWIDNRLRPKSPPVPHQTRNR